MAVEREKKTGTHIVPLFLPYLNYLGDKVVSVRTVSPLVLPVLIECSLNQSPIWQFSLQFFCLCPPTLDRMLSVKERSAQGGKEGSHGSVILQSVENGIIQEGIFY